MFVNLGHKTCGIYLRISVENFHVVYIWSANWSTVCSCQITHHQHVYTSSKHSQKNVSTHGVVNWKQYNWVTNRRDTKKLKFKFLPPLICLGKSINGSSYIRFVCDVLEIIKFLLRAGDVWTIQVGWNVILVEQRKSVVNVAHMCCKIMQLSKHLL